jgi:ribonuclease HI
MLQPWINYASEVETYSTTICPPWVETKVKIGISRETKEDSAKSHRALYTNLTTGPENDRNIIAYTDGSMLNEVVGAGGIVQWTGDFWWKFEKALGHQMEVYDAELIGIRTAAEQIATIILESNWYDKAIWIFTDNQAAVNRVASLHAGPRQDIAIAISDVAKQLYRRRCTLIIEWVPGHTDVPGNEEADRLAKKATTRPQPSMYHTSLSYLKRAARSQMVEEWRQWWYSVPNKGKGYSGEFRVKTDKFFNSGNRKIISTITQLRTTHGYLRSYLSKIPNNNIDTPYCLCHRGFLQNTRHLLMQCSLYATERAEMRQLASHIPKMRLQTLLYTNAGYTPLEHYLRETNIVTRRWMLGQTPEIDVESVTTETLKSRSGWGGVLEVEEEHESDREE